MTPWSARLRVMRIVARRHMPRIAAEHALVWLVAAVVIAQFWTQIPWAAIRTGLYGSPATRVGAAAILWLALGVRTRPTEPWMRVVPRPYHGILRLPEAIFVVWPALFAASLFPAPLTTAALFVAAAAWRQAGAWWAPVLLLGAAWWPAALLVPASLWRVGWRATLIEQSRQHRAWVPRSRIGAVVWRDLACLWRTERATVWAALLVAVPLGVLERGLRANGGLSGRALADAAAVLLCVAAPVGGAAVAGLRRQLGPQLAPAAWPVGRTERAATLFLVAALWMLPTSSALAASGAEGVVLPGTHVALAAGAAAGVSRGAFSHGRFAWVALGVAAVVLAGFGGLTGLLALPFFAWCAWRLR